MHRLAFLLAATAALAACEESNAEQYCMNPANGSDPRCHDAGGTDIDGGTTTCSTSTDCKNVADPVCDTTKHECVECTADDKHACVGDKPVCDTTNKVCAACSSDSDCMDGAATGVCLPSGACAAQASILHVTLTAPSPADCGAFDKPCKFDMALGKINKNLNIIRIDDDSSYTTMAGYTLNNDVTIDGWGAVTGATFGRSKDGPIFLFDDSRKITFLGGTIAGATGAGGDSIRCTDSTPISGPTGSITVVGTTIESNNESAIEASDCNLYITRAIIKSNSTNSNNTANVAIKLSDGSITMSQTIVSGNRGGGFTATGSTKFTVVGNLFRDNGDTGSNTSGVSITTSSGGNRFDFNTVTQNKSQSASVAGFNCSAANFTALNNIISQNTGTNQVSAGCVYQYSAIGPTPVADTGNISDPMFVSTTDAHLMSGSLARNAAKPGSDLTGIAAKDIDSHDRAAGGNTNAADMGAYVYATP